MRTVFTSVTRLFRRPSFLTAARSHPTTTTASSPSSSPTSSPRRSRKSRNKSRHELVSDAHIAYMQQASTSPYSSSLSSSSSSSLSLPFSSPLTESSEGCCNEEREREGEEEASSPAFESLCHELRRVEESMSRYLFDFEPNHIYANGPLHLHPTRSHYASIRG